MELFECWSNDIATCGICKRRLPAESVKYIVNRKCETPAFPKSHQPPLLSNSIPDPSYVNTHDREKIRTCANSGPFGQGPLIRVRITFQPLVPRVAPVAWLELHALWPVMAPACGASPSPLPGLVFGPTRHECGRTNGRIDF